MVYMSRTEIIFYRGWTWILVLLVGFCKYALFSASLFHFLVPFCSCSENFVQDVCTGPISVETRICGNASECKSLINGS
jgi:hypothetical protein